MRLAGLESFIGNVNFNQSARIFSGSLVERLRIYGGDALARLVRYLIELLGEGEDRRFLEGLLSEGVQPSNS
ncbi:MAG: hypothetical protein SNJ58_10725 [Aggregatilineales bacterium]